MFSAPSNLASCVQRAALVPNLVLRVNAIYEAIEGELAVIAPRCETSGRCCRFQEYGHRLFVTTAEVATFVEAVRRLATKPDTCSDLGICRFQKNRICMAHVIRPMGCRLFFCDPRHTQELQSLYERMHSHMKRLHDELGVPYMYVEWQQALVAIESLLQSHAALGSPNHDV